jgi:putative oxidoreductase
MLQEPSLLLAQSTVTSAPSSLPLWVRVVSWSAQIIVALIMLQTLYFKFTYAPETQVIFEPRGGRLAATVVAIFELICLVLLLWPRLSAMGAVLSLLVISGAIFTHLTSLGITVPESPGSTTTDGGLLFGLALAVAFGSLVVLACRWQQLPFVGRLLQHS